MGCEVYWSAAARTDVEQITRYIADTLGSPKAAGEHLDAFARTADDIALFPEACAVSAHPSLASRALRAKFVKRYVMLYSYDGDSAIVSRVFHSLQDYARILA